MKTVFLIHGYNGIPPIFKWLKGKLAKKGYQVIVPEFPNGEKIDFNLWIKTLDLYKDKFDENITIIAHSIGNSFALRYININNIHLKLFISLAGFCEKFKVSDNINLSNAISEFCDTNEIIEAKKNIDKMYAIYSNTDHIVPINILKSFAERLSAEAILLENVGHIGAKSGIKQLPEVMEIIEKDL